MRRTITILFVGIILLFASCTQYRIIPYPIPDSLGTGNENTDLPHFTVDKENGLLFEDDFTTDTTIYYDPGLVDDKITDNRADNMVVENGVAKLYGGGADIRFDSDSSNDPVTGVAPGYSHSYTFDTTSNNYTLTVKGSIPASFNTETMQTDFFGLLVGLYSGETSLYAPSAGVRFWKMR